MSTPLNALLVEDSQDDADLIVAELRRAGFLPDSKRVETEQDFLAAIQDLPDVILCDYSLPRFDALRAARLLEAGGLNIPFILISGTVGEEVAVEAMRHGAVDYLLKDRIARLGSAVRHALEQKRLREERRRTDAEMRRQLAELQRWHEAMLGREGRILELKREVNEQLVRQQLPPRYAPSEPI